MGFAKITEIIASLPTLALHWLARNRGVVDGGGGGESQDPCTFENRGDDPQKCGYCSILFLKRRYQFFAFSKIFQTKWPNSEEKLHFGGRWV